MAIPSAEFDKANDILGLFSASQRRIEAEMAAILTDPRAGRARARLAGLSKVIEAEVDAMTKASGRFSTEVLPDIYQAGGVASGSPFRWSQFNREAIASLGEDTYQDLLAATAGVTEDSKRWIRDTARQLSAQGYIEGTPASTLAKRFRDLGAQAVADSGVPIPITSVVYANGTRQTFEVYSEMVIRTKTAVAYNAGAVNSGVSAGVTRFEIFDGPGCGLTAHNDGTVANGMIVDAETAAAYPLSHPNCRRSFGGRPDLDGTPVPPAPVREGGPFQVPLPTTAALARRARRTPRAPRAARVPRKPRSVVSAADSVSAASRAAEAAVAARASAVAAEVASRSLSGALYQDAVVAAARSVKGNAQTTVLSTRRTAPSAGSVKVLNAGIDAADVLLKAGGGDEAAAIFRKLAGGVGDVSVGTTSQTINQARRGSVRGAWYYTENALMMETKRFDPDLWFKRVSDYRNRLTRKKPQTATANIAPDNIAGTFIHELTHTLDYVSERALGQSGMLRNRLVEDGIFDEVKTIHKALEAAEDAGAGEWAYAASEPAEALPELSRMYFQGIRGGNAAAGEAWRNEYPELAAWVKDNILDPSLLGF